MLVKSEKKLDFWVTNHIKAIPWRIASNDIDLLVRIKPNNIFESDCIID